MKFVLQVPLDRIRRDLTTRKLPLALGFLVSQIERAAELLGPIDGEHWKQLVTGTWAGTDATGLKVLVPGLPNTHHGQLEVYRRPDVVVFQYEADKAATRWSPSSQASRACSSPTPSTGTTPG